MLFLVHKNWERNSVNRFLGALRASNWLFMVVGVLMAMTILWILEEDEGNRVKYAFSEKKNREKKSDGIFLNNLNFMDERGKSKFQKKHGLVLCLTSSFESYLQKPLFLFIFPNNGYIMYLSNIIIQ